MSILCELYLQEAISNFSERNNEHELAEFVFFWSLFDEYLLNGSSIISGNTEFRSSFFPCLDHRFDFFVDGFLVVFINLFWDLIPVWPCFKIFELFRPSLKCFVVTTAWSESCLVQGFGSSHLLVTSHGIIIDVSLHTIVKSVCEFLVLNETLIKIRFIPYSCPSAIVAFHEPLRSFRVPEIVRHELRSRCIVYEYLTHLSSKHARVKVYAFLPFSDLKVNISFNYGFVCLVNFFGDLWPVLPFL